MAFGFFICCDNERITMFLLFTASCGLVNTRLFNICVLNASSAPHNIVEYKLPFLNDVSFVRGVDFATFMIYNAMHRILMSMKHVDITVFGHNTYDIARQENEETCAQTQHQQHI
jgi:hypothetical protein